MMRRQPDLSQVVQAPRPPRRFAHILDRWQQHADQDADDGDGDQQFNQRKGGSFDCHDADQ